MSITYDSGKPTITIPAKGSVSRYFMFLLFWLGGWAFSFVAVSSQLMSGKGNLSTVLGLAPGPSAAL
jgi:hypothetical protein